MGICLVPARGRAPGTRKFESRAFWRTRASQTCVLANERLLELVLGKHLEVFTQRSRKTPVKNKPKCKLKKNLADFDQR